MKVSDISILKRLILQARPFWGRISFIYLLNFLAIPLALLTPLPLMLAVDSVIGTKPLPEFLQLIMPNSLANGYGLLLAIIAFTLLLALLGQLQSLLLLAMQTEAGEKMVLQFRARLFRHAQMLSLNYHDSRGTVDAVYRIQYDTPSIQWIVLNGITPLITALFTLIGMIWITASIDSQLALVALAVTPFVFVLTNIYRQRLRQRWKTAKRLESSAMSVVQEVFSSLRVVKAFGQESREDDRFVRHSKDSLDSKVSAIWIEGVFNMLLALVIAGGTAAVLYLGIRHIQLGLLSLGEFLLIMGYLGQLYGPIQNLGKQITSLQNGFSSAERAYQLLDESPEVVEHARAVPINQCPGGIVFKDVTFAYPQHEAVIEGMTVNFPAGTIIGIAGKTGEGKSTLVSLILRFYDVDRGQILLDGIDIRDRAIADLRYQFALVLKEPVLFSTSIRENIAYARPGANFAEIIEAAKAAKAHEFIEQLPEGYDTQVGERGMLLSGGQRQRISIARAFLKDAPILILDEPTSSLDVPTENEMLKELSTLMKNRTTLLISHRLSALKMCDQIYVLKKGKLEQVSTVDSAVREMTVKTPDLETIANEKSG